MKLLPLPAFADNYFWLIVRDDKALVVDPGLAAPVFKALEEQKLTLEAILITHHHSDHIAGVEELRQATQAKVYAPNHPSIPKPFQSVCEGDSIESVGIGARVFEVAGHTLTHVAYFFEQTPLGPLLFCGDTLFSGGCGRMFEGDPVGFLSSLDKLAQLPKETLVCAAHEYTLSNLKFAKAVEPNNSELDLYIERCNELRQSNQPTLPSTIAQELLINPFLRVREPSVQQSAKSFDALAKSDSEIFASLRQWKNVFQ